MAAMQLTHREKTPVKQTKTFKLPVLYEDIYSLYKCDKNWRIVCTKTVLQ